MGEKLSRREFFKAGGALALALAVGCREEEVVEVKQRLAEPARWWVREAEICPKIDFVAMHRFWVFLREQINRIKASGWEFDLNKETAWEIAREMTPLFATEGAVYIAYLPSEINFIDYRIAGDHEARWGTTDCMDRIVWINGRMDNQFSHLDKIPYQIQFLAHELTHGQQGEYCGEPLWLVEATAQIVSFEILASMARAGNRDALFGLIYGLELAARGATYYLARTEGRMDEYQKMKGLLKMDVIDAEYLAQVEEDYAQSWFAAEEVLYLYSVVPLQMIAKAITEDGNRIEGLALNMPTYGADPNTGEAVELEPIFEVNDLAEILERMESLVRTHARRVD